MDILSRIFSELKKSGKSQVELAEFLGLHKNNITDWKAGRSKSYMKYLYQIAAFFQLEVDYFLGKTEYPKFVSSQPMSDELHQLIDLLDIEDRAELKGTVKQMLKSDKYKENSFQIITDTSRLTAKAAAKTGARKNVENISELDLLEMEIEEQNS